MYRAHYFVVIHEGEWTVKLGDKHYGPYSRQADAINAAIDAAQQYGRQNLDVQVLVQSESNQFKTEWAYGYDPYVPTG